MTRSCFRKLHLILLFTFTLTGLHSFAQGYDTTKWRFSNPKQFGFTIFDLDFVNNERAIAVGNDGGIAFTTNAGVKWTYGPYTFLNAAGQRVKTSFQDVHFVNTNTAYAVGGQGCMIKSTDGGASWNFVNTPLFANGKNINAVWFINKDTGYIGGQFNTPDSLPKLYRTYNGGATWDSLSAPMGGKTVVGYVNNPNLAPFVWDVTAKNKEIYRIEFINDSTGYVSGTASGLFPPHAAVNTSTCLPNGSTTSTSAHDAPLVWKVTRNGLVDYSPSKERLGYTGINTTTINCSTRFGNISPQVQQYRAMKVINDSMIVMISFNNSIALRIFTGRNDSTLNANLAGVYERGRYQVTNFPFPPNGATPIPNPQVLNASNPYHMKQAANGKLYAGANFAALWTSVDTGRTWVREASLPQGQNYSNLGTWALDFTPSGRLFTAGTIGVVADSIPGGSFASSYVSTPLSGGYAEMEFPTCNNGIAVGGASITVTNDGGATWIDRFRPDFQALNINITSLAYPAPNRAYITTSVGTLYKTVDQGASLDPVHANSDLQFNDVAVVGNDTLYVVAYSAFTIPTASRTSKVLRSFDGGNNWTEIGGFPVGSTAPRLDKIAFPSRNIGYVAGSRNAVYKTTDGGSTWTNISPFPALNAAPSGFPNAFVNYTEVFALNDTTVFLTGNMFTSTGIKRVYKTTDGGANWTDITGNISALNPVGNLNGILMHDANNGYAISPGGVLYTTTNGGTSWTLDLAPTNNLFETLAFAPAKVGPSISMSNRRVFVTGANLPNGGAPVMEFGDLRNVNVNTTETITPASCTNPTGSITINTTGGIAPYTYSLNGGAFQTGNAFTGLTAGQDTITIRDAYCGLVTKVITVPFNDNLTLTANNDTTVCAGAPVPLLASTNGSGAAFTWSPSAGLSNPAIANPVATVTNAAAFTVRATLNGCVRTRSVNISIRPNPIVNAGPDKTILIGDSAQLSGSGSGNSVSVLWSPAASLARPNTFTPMASPQQTTTYTMTVRDANGCTSTDDAVVTVIPYCVQVMDAFTPNGDGINDKWLVTKGTSCTKVVTVRVYNRYGSEVYRNDNYSDNWDGSYNGKPLTDGTYYYMVDFTLFNGKRVQLKGNVTILR